MNDFDIFSKMSLFEKLSRLRSLAAMLNDKAEVSGMSPEQIAREIQPIRDLMQQLVAKDAEEAPERVAGAVLGFSEQKRSMLEMAQIYQTKAQDAQTHADFLKAALLKRMRQRGEDYLEADGFLISRVRVEGGETILVR